MNLLQENWICTTKLNAEQTEKLVMLAGFAGFEIYEDLLPYDEDFPYLGGTDKGILDMWPTEEVSPGELVLNITKLRVVLRKMIKDRKIKT